MDMLSIAVASPAGTEQADVLSVLSDKVTNEGISFAQSFDEHVALVADAETPAAFKRGVVELPDGQNGDSPNIADNPAPASALVKNPTPASLGAVLFAEGDNSVPRIISPNEAEIVPGGLQSKSIYQEILAESGSLANGALAKNVDPTAIAPNALEEPTIAHGESTEQDGFCSNKVEDTMTNELVEPSDLSPALMDAPSKHNAIAVMPNGLRVLRGNEGDAIRKEEAVKKAQEGTSNKVSKKQEVAAKGVTPHKDVRGTGNATEVITQPGPALQGAAPVAASVLVTGVLPGEQQSMDKSQKSSEKAVVSGRKIAVAQTEATEGKDGKQVHAAKVSADNTESATPVAAPKFESESTKTVSPASTAGHDGDTKPQSAAGITPQAHAVADVSAVASGLAAGISSTHAAGNAPSGKTQSGDVNVHVAAAHAGSSEQDSPGASMPQVVDGTHKTLIATPNVLEVGIANGTQGWLKIRAEMSDRGVVNASLTTASQAGQEMLHRELPSLTAYLQQERVAVNTVIVHPAAIGTESRSLAGGAGGNAQRQTQQGNGQGGDSQPAVANAAADEITYGGSSVVGADGLAASLQYANSGSWLSVRA